jgi:hypothetical protein
MPSGHQVSEFSRFAPSEARCFGETRLNRSPRVELSLSTKPAKLRTRSLIEDALSFGVPAEPF